MPTSGFTWPGSYLTIKANTCYHGIGFSRRCDGRQKTTHVVSTFVVAAALLVSHTGLIAVRMTMTWDQRSASEFPSKPGRGKFC